MDQILIHSTHQYTYSIKMRLDAKFSAINEALSEEEFQLAIDSFSYDLIILDSHNHESISYLCNLIQKSKYNEKVSILFLLPCRTSINKIQTSLENNFVAGLMKPFSPEELISTSIDLIQKKKARTQLSNTLEEVDQFATMAAHDLKTPLKNIYSLADMINTMSEDGELNCIEVGELSKLIFDEAEKMLSHVDNIYNLAKTGTKQNSFETFHLKTYIDNIISKISNKHSDKNIQCFIGPFPEMITFDKSSLDFIIQNILDNAVKYCDKEIVNIWIEYSMPHNKAFQISIKDNGEGISDGSIDKIFFPLRRLTTKGDGLGMGLSIVSKLIKSLNGSIEVVSKLSEGSEFKLTFPIFSDRELNEVS